MQPNTFYSDIISSVKAQNSCVDFCRFTLGINVPYPGKAIHAPDFIRSGDSHPSFAVYEDHAYDFASNTSYDIFDLLMAAKGISFPQAFAEIAGKPLSAFVQTSEKNPNPFWTNSRTLADDVSQWHSNLKSSKKALDYLEQRGISIQTANDMLLGYNPKTDRLIIPFFRNHKPVYWAGRDLSGHGSPKYLYATTDWGIHKIPFGIQSLTPGRKKQKPGKSFEDTDGQDSLAYIKSSSIVLTEGLIDAISLIQDKWQVLASGGGSFGKNNINYVIDMIRKYDHVYLAYDNDKAGRDFQLKMGKWLLGERIPFSCITIPHSLDGHVVKDINDYYCAGGKFEDLAKSAQKGVVFCGSQLNTVQEVYEFVQSVAGYATSWDLQTLYNVLGNRTVGSLAGDPDPEDPATMDMTPLFSKGELRAAIKSAGTRVTDKELMRRVLKKHQIIFSPDGKFYEYNHRYWEQITKETVKRYVSHAIGERANDGRCSAVMQLMKIELEDATPFNAQHVVTFPNGVLLLDEPDPEKRFVPHSPDFRSTFMEDFTFNPFYKPEARKMWSNLNVYHPSKEDTYEADLEHSEWWKFLKAIFPKPGVGADIPLIRELQKMCGYIYFTDNKLEKTFIFMGKGGNGKSTLMQIIEDVVGSEFCTHLRPNRLASSFDPIVLRNSILNICHEASKDMEGAEETLKAVTSGNPIMASYKGQDAISFTPRAKWIISTNSPMDVKDVSYAFLRRLIFFPFTAKFTDGKEDTVLLDKLRKEKALIFAWMYEGYLLLKNGEKFKETPKQLAKKAEIQEIVDHTLMFVREYLVEKDYVDTLDSVPGERGSYIPMRRLPTDRTIYVWYLKWCKSSNVEPLSRPEAISRINDAIGILCPAMKIIHAIETDSARERDIYVMPDFADKVESISQYDMDTQDAITEVFYGKKDDNKITPQGNSIPSMNNEARECARECPSPEEKKSTPSGGKDTCKSEPELPF